MGLQKRLKVLEPVIYIGSRTPVILQLIVEQRRRIVILCLPCYQINETNDDGVVDALHPL